MNHSSSAKQLLKAFNQKQYHRFLVSDASSLSLLSPSSVPWIGTSGRVDVYDKIVGHKDASARVTFVTKNKDPHAFLWQTNPDTLKQAVRWGIVRTESVTGKVIAKLGYYRVVAHERALKGMISHAHTEKMQCLDIFQDRFEALQDIESLLNQKKSFEEYKTVLLAYCHKLTEIQKNIQHSSLDEAIKKKLNSDVIADTKRAHAYLEKMAKHRDLLHRYRRARGEASLGEFIKQQMMHGLYQFQGINQDMTYDKNRAFALTRGELNDCIEDARKELDDHQADLKNVVTPKHHGLYSADNTAVVTYDFAEDHLSSDRQRQVLLAISFIEGWDTLVQTSTGGVVRNASGTELLDNIKATRWKTHRNGKGFIKSIGFYLWHIAKSILFSVHPWEEETWANRTFHLVATKLRQLAHPQEPLWHKPYKLFKKIAHAIKDIGYGIYDAGSDLVWDLPLAIKNDWHATEASDSLLTCISSAEQGIIQVNKDETARLQTLFSEHPTYQKPNLVAECGLILMSYDPLPTDEEQRDATKKSLAALTENKPCYLLYNSKIYFIDDKLVPTELEPKDTHPDWSIFPVEKDKKEPATKKQLDTITSLTGHSLAVKSMVWAQTEYPLTPGCQNDILTAVVRGLQGFGGFFTHTIYARDPMAGLLFISAYAVGAAAMYLPSFTASILGGKYVSGFYDFAHTMGGSEFVAMVAGASTQAQIASSIADIMAHGPSSMTMDALYQCTKDPLTVGAYFFTAYGLGYLLANGAFGHPIPGLSHFFQEDFGSVPETTYPLIGGKVAIGIYELFKREQNLSHSKPSLVKTDDRLHQEACHSDAQKTAEQFLLIQFLSIHAKVLPKLDEKQRFMLTRHIHRLFGRKKALSLAQMLEPDVPASIAFQLFFMPLSYVGAVLRCFSAVALGVVAWALGRRAPWEPIKRSGEHLFYSAKKDLSRLAVFLIQTTYLLYMTIAGHLKVFAFVAMMAIGRVAALLGESPGHRMHRGLASIHAFFRRAGEFFYPVTALKRVAVAHPNLVITRVNESYKTLLQSLPKQESRLSNASLTSSPLPLTSRVKEEERPSPVIADGISYVERSFLLS